ncbi:hypothetical protein NG755_10915 [Aliarcobacter cryaerophilus]|uniref:hypothetical protein n=1 Tax=Aliarcobacter cryaerophilus TaxID=28198 RepID=UPI003DA6B5F0
MFNLKNVSGSVLGIIIIFIIYSFFNDNNSQIKKDENNIVNSINNKRVEVVSTNTESSVLNIQKIEEKDKEKQIEEKGKVLFSSVDSTGRYTILLINEVDIEIPKRNSVRYVPINGEIKENSTVSEFTISISQDYLNFISDLKLKIVDNMNEDRVLETHTYFLGALNLDSFYELLLNISGDTLDGSIKSSSKLSDFMIEELSKDEPIIIDEDIYNKSLLYKENIEAK